MELLYWLCSLLTSKMGVTVVKPCPDSMTRPLYLERVISKHIMHGMDIIYVVSPMENSERVAEFMNRTDWDFFVFKKVVYCSCPGISFAFLVYKYFHIIENYFRQFLLVLLGVYWAVDHEKITS